MQSSLISEQLEDMPEAEGLPLGPMHFCISIHGGL